jgi:ribosomal protein S17
MVHDELDCREGDLVRVVESQPLSARKRWVIEEILKRYVGDEEWTEETLS